MVKSGMLKPYVGAYTQLDVRVNLPECCVAERMPNIRIKCEETGQLRFA